MSLQYNNSFSKNISLALAVQLPFRTDSKPLRRRFVGKTGFGRSRRTTLQNNFRQSFESSPESRGSQTSGVLFGSFCTTQKARKTFLSQEAPRFCKARISTPQPRLRTAIIKTFAGRNKVLQTLFQRTKTPTSHSTQTNVQQPFSNIACCCELAVQQSIFEKHQSCVCTTVTLSHRFKAFTPALCRQNRFRHEPPENFAKLLPAEL